MKTTVSEREVTANACRNYCERWGRGGVYDDFFFFNDTATTEIYTLSLHDALPIWYAMVCRSPDGDDRTTRRQKVARFVGLSPHGF